MPCHASWQFKNTSAHVHGRKANTQLHQKHIHKGEHRHTQASANLHIISTHGTSIFSLTVAGTPSSCLPPWLDTIIPWTPCLTASSASSFVKMPLTMMGRWVRLRSQWISFQVTEGSKLLGGSPYSEQSSPYSHRTKGNLIWAATAQRPLKPFPALDQIN